VSRAACILVGCLMALSSAACSSEARYDAVVAAASDTRDAFIEVAALAKTQSGVDIGFVFGSSGLLREQVIAGAPYDVYVAANTAFVDDVIAAGKGVGTTRESFAVGRLALITASDVELPNSLQAVTTFSRIVIANPAHAPYGVAARETLERLGVYEEVVSRLILADNVADAVRIVRAGEAQAGFVALPLVIDTSHLVVAQDLHQPIRQALVVTTKGVDNPAAQAFISALTSPAGRAILQRYGFMVES
jgi:molybdate transport system substrate-binding protein